MTWNHNFFDILRGPVVQKPINANPGLKVNQSSYFYWIKVFLLSMFPGVWHPSKPKLKDIQFKQKTSLKRYKIEIKFSIILDKLNLALNNLAQFWVFSLPSHSHLLWNNCTWNCTSRVIGLSVVCNGLTVLRSSGTLMCPTWKYPYPPEQQGKGEVRGGGGEGRGRGRGREFQKRKVLNENLKQNRPILIY